MTRALVVALALAAGCKLDTKYGGTTYQCGVPERCPGGFVCVDGYCQEDPAADGDGGTSTVIDASAGPRFGGDIVWMTFDDRNQPLLWDRSGHRHDAHQGGSEPTAGRYGGGVQLDSDDSIYMADTAAYFAGAAITIEAWINRDTGGVERGVWGDRAVSGGMVAAEASLEIDVDDHLVFLTNHNCSLEELAAVSSGTVPVGTWAHVAVAWDGEVARFYVDGEAAGEAALEAAPCELERGHRIGRRSGDGTNDALTGVIDEVKVSSVAKTQEDIQASMDFDSTELIGSCGDGVVEMQDCEAGACCDGDCEAADDNAPCMQDGTCQAGACMVDGVRVTDGLIALYDFQEGAGAVVGDSSGLDPAIDLTIANTATVDWQADGLDILGDSSIASAGSTARLSTACAASDEVTLELWVTTQTDTAYGNIAYLSDGVGDVSIGVQQIGAAYIARIRSEISTGDGTPVVDSADGDGVEALTHLVVTRSEVGVRRFYVNGRLRSVNHVPGQLDWVERPLAIADQSGDDNPWFGTYHLMALYDRALTVAEVARNFSAGPP